MWRDDGTHPDQVVQLLTRTPPRRSVAQAQQLFEGGEEALLPPFQLQARRQLSKLRLRVHRRRQRRLAALQRVGVGNGLLPQPRGGAHVALGEQDLSCGGGGRRR